MKTRGMAWLLVAGVAVGILVGAGCSKRRTRGVEVGGPPETMNAAARPTPEELSANEEAAAAKPSTGAAKATEVKPLERKMAKRSKPDVLPLTPPPQGAKAPPIKWLRDVDQGLKTAKKQGKPVLLEVFVGKQEPCQYMDKYVWADPEVRKLAERYVCVRIQPTAKPNDRDMAVAKRYNVKNIPAVIILRSSGSEVTRVEHLIHPDAMVTMMKKGLGE